MLMHAFCRRVIAIAIVALCASTTTSFAAIGLYAADSADTGPDGYTLTDLTPQNPDVTGFTDAWTDGTTATSTWSVAGGGLTSSVTDGESGGRFTYSGFAGGIRRVYRDVTPYSEPSSSPVYFISALIRLEAGSVEFDGSGQTIAGIIDTAQDGVNDTDFFTDNNGSTAGLEGLMWGFRDNGSGGADLIVRARQDANPDPGNSGDIQMLSTTIASDITIGETYQLVMKLERNVVGAVTLGNDRVSIWINPTDVNNEADATLAGAPVVVENYSLNTSDALRRLVFASSNFGNSVSHDEIRFGSAWGDVAVLNRQIAVDSFESYAAGTNVNTSPNGGTGWGGPWTATDGTGTFSMEDPGTPLSAPGSPLGDGGDRALRIRGFVNGTTFPGGTTSERSITRALDGPETGDLFGSFLVRFTGTADTDDLWDFRVRNGSDTAARFGVKFNGASGGGDFFAASGGTTTLFPDVQFDTSVDHFMVFRVFKNGGSSTYNALMVWLDPGSMDLASPTFVVGGTTALDFIDGIRIAQRDLDEGDFVFIDNLVLGSSWSDVVIPAPSAMAILLPSAMAVTLRRRRRV